MIPIRLLRQAPLTAALCLLFAYLLSPLFTYHLGPGGFNDQRLLQLLWMTACLFSVLAIGRYRAAFFTFLQRLSRAGALCLLLFFVFAIASSALAAVPQRAFQEVGLYALLLVAIVAVMHELSRLETREVENLLILALSVWLVVYALYFLIYYYAIFVQVPERYLERRIWMPNFYNHRAFNQVEVWLLPAFFWLCHRARLRSAGLSVPVFTITAVWWVMLFYTHGRGISLAMLVGTAGVALLFRKRALVLLKPALITFVAGLVLYWLMFVLPPQILFGESGKSYLERIQDTHSGGRWPLWVFAWESFLQNPFFGLGPQHYGFYSVRLSHAHNITLNSLAELGLLGSLPLFALALVGAVAAIRGALAGGSPFSILLVFCLLAVATYSQFTAQFYFPAAQLLLVLFVALAIDRHCRDRPEGTRQARGWTRPRVAFPALALAAALSALCVYVSAIDVITTPHALYQVRYYNYPRFWLNGDFRRFPQRQVSPRPGACKVHPYAPVFPCR